MAGSTSRLGKREAMKPNSGTKAIIAKKTTVKS